MQYISFERNVCIILKCSVLTKEKSDPGIDLDSLSNCLLMDTGNIPAASKRIGTHNLCDAAAVPYQLNEGATKLEVGQFFGLMCPRERNDE